VGNHYNIIKDSDQHISPKLKKKKKLKKLLGQCNLPLLELSFFKQKVQKNAKRLKGSLS